MDSAALTWRQKGSLEFLAWERVYLSSALVIFISLTSSQKIGYVTHWPADIGPSQGLHDLECLSTLHSSTVLFVYIGRGILCIVLYPASYIQPYNTIFPYFQSCSNITSNSGEYISIYSHYTSGLLFLSLFFLFFFFCLMWKLCSYIC